ncbi:MAG: hypothetical protein RLP15_08825 [Cryomorphaceae bacterium]
MDNVLIKFDALDWEPFRRGAEQKIHDYGESRMRMLRFHDDFIEEDWCQHGHIGYVLEGTMTVNFNGTMKAYKMGDGLWIQEGDAEKHKVIIKEGEHVVLILFEKIR